MPVPYIKQTWADGSGGGTPISATRLGVIEQGIEDAQFPSPGYVLLEDEFFNAASAADEIGILGWQIVNSAMGVSTYEPPQTDHPGIHRIAATTTAGNIYGIASQDDGADGFILPPQVERLIWIVAPNAANASTLFRVGLCQNPSVANCGTNGVWWDYSNSANTNWRAISRGASVNTTNNSTVTVVVNNWYKLELRRRSDNGNWEFWANNTLRFTHSTNLPSTTVPLTPFAVVEIASTSSKQLDIDYFGLMSVSLGNRYT